MTKYPPSGHGGMNISLECLNDQMWDFLVEMRFSVGLNVIRVFFISRAKQRPVLSGSSSISVPPHQLYVIQSDVTDMQTEIKIQLWFQ